MLGLVKLCSGLVLLRRLLTGSSEGLQAVWCLRSSAAALYFLLLPFVLCGAHFSSALQQPGCALTAPGQANLDS